MNEKSLLAVGIRHPFPLIFLAYLELYNCKKTKKYRTMASFDVKDELGNIGGDIARSGVNRLVNVVINSLTNYFRKRSAAKKAGTATQQPQDTSVPPQAPIQDNTNEQSENF